MSVTLKNIDPVHAIITVAMKKEEYQPVVEKSLSDIRKKTTIAGFRKGNAPKARIQAMYGQSVLEDEINKSVSGQLQEYIRENLMDLLGEPIPHNEQLITPVYEHPEDYEFVFDVGISPKLNVTLTKDDSFPYYIITPSNDLVEEQIENYKNHCGQYLPVETIEMNDQVKGILTEQDGHLQNDSASLIPAYIKNPEEQAKWIGATIGDTITFNPSTVYAGQEAELASFLAIKKEEINAHPGDFTFTIQEIFRYQKAELGQEFYDRLYEPGTVTSEDALKEKVRASLAEQLAPNSDYKFGIDVKKVLNDRSQDVQFPIEFLKRWLSVSDPNRTPQEVETDYPNLVSSLRNHLINEQLIKTYNIQTTQEEVVQRAVSVVRAQFAQYGMGHVPDEVLEPYVQKLFKEKKTIDDLVNQILEDKLIRVLKEQVTLQPQTITWDDFKQLLKK
jgi:trigger factor